MNKLNIVLICITIFLLISVVYATTCVFNMKKACEINFTNYQIEENRINDLNNQIDELRSNKVSK